MELLIIGQCSGTKAYPANTPEFTPEQIDSTSRDQLVEEAEYSDVARCVYTGRQQTGITDAVEVLRSAGHNVQRFFVSAGFGLVSESDELPPYDTTFETETEAKERGHKLGLPSRIREVLRTATYDVVFFPMGAKYYTAIDLPSVIDEIPKDAVAVVFNQDRIAKSQENVLSLLANTETGQKDRIGGGVMGVKAEYLKNFAENVSSESVPKSVDDVQRLCLPQSGSTEQVSLDSLDERE